MPATDSDANGSTAPIVTIAEGRATIRLNRPRQHNRIEPDDLTVLRETFVRIDGDPSIRVLVLTGSGAKSFSSGYHIGALIDRSAGHPHGEEPGSNAFERTVDALEGLRVPTIAALNGSVYGGATDLALACDFRIGVEGMRLVMPAARLGIVYYASGIERYVSRLGIAAAKKMFMTAQPIETAELPHRLSRRGGAGGGAGRPGRCAGGGPRGQRAFGARRVEAGDQRDRRRPARPRRAENGAGP